MADEKLDLSACYPACKITVAGPVPSGYPDDWKPKKEGR